MPRLATLALISALALLGGCSGLTKIDLSLESSNKLNPDLNGRPSPVVLHLIELKHPVAFENADFFSIYQHPRETLTPDFVRLEELEMRPGERRNVKFSVAENSRYLGVLAAYRDLSGGEWRTVIPLRAKKKHKVSLYLDERGIRGSGNTSGRD
ncbi:type VI secretion system lipoprotein TssJ [Pseudomonas sp. OIL-1]|uniref:type VI secretion system lipoprotein TssJ n=1 Tax=Pseudomonas sp. OIL-1 TaxID=2706126 RepID=UPI0013A77913|nr:type VI secretion system lipoprotein TssJ [Pseudomonas sp. OIL-1]QIB51856.1 type VI secretion system lipoprotein TssJ [Pseudomonas sp. OIL-1]